MATEESSQLRRGLALGAGSMLLTGAAAALLTGLAGSAGATGSTFTVDAAGDGAADAAHCTNGTAGDCTLRDALTAATDGDTVNFDAGIAAITLTQGQISMNAASILGPGSANLTITSTRNTGTYNAFYLSGTGDAILSGFTLVGNRIYTNHTGNITLDDVSITGSDGGYGGALYTSGTGDLAIINSHFENNTGTSAGGAVYAYNAGNVTITNSTFLNNSAVGNDGGAMRISNNVVDASITGTIFEGSIASYGGGIFARNTGDLELIDDVFSNNSATGGGGGGYIDNYGDVTVTRTTFDSNSAGSGNWGGALYLGHETDAITITESTFSNNEAGSGGAISLVSSDPVLIANSTMTGNSAIGSAYLGRAGALYIASGATDVTLAQDTISGNTAAVAGGGIFTQADLTLSGTIVSANTATVGDPDIDGTQGRTVSSTHSLIGQIGSNLTLIDVAGTVRSDTPGLLALADNGGPTLTMALAPTSPAIGAGPDPVFTFPGNGSDQRGLPYVRIYGGVADIGAVEGQPDPNPPAPTTSTAGPDPVVPAFTG